MIRRRHYHAGMKEKNKKKEPYIKNVTTASKVGSKVGDRSRGQQEGSLFNRYYIEV